MFAKRLSWLAIIVVIVGFVAQNARAGDLKLTLPKRSHLTPVQRLNREGVDAIQKHNYEKAETLFYQAYLFDPADPFTLYNLGYVSELKGQLERAQKLYSLASEQATDAVIDRTSVQQLEGKPMRDAFGSLKDVTMQVNRMNVEAIRLLSQGRAPEALVVLQKALALDPHNTYTLNNLGVAKEARGDYDEALKYYAAAADSRSSEPVIVTLNRAWRGKPVSEMAADSEKKLRERMQNAATAEAQAALLNVRGVSATNHNDWSTAREDFLKAYSLNPNSAFSLNNIGYLAEREGDLETAEFFYQRARSAQDARVEVGLATRQSAEGMRLFAVATDSDQKVDGEITRENEARRRHPGPVELKHRDNTPVVEPVPQPAGPQSSVAPAPVSQPPVPQTPQ
ncbi:MAG TPA: tetratricopeptide repeat protein [Terriglobales bacterium]|nr:tetratricopeptide repeat protein [Terriglobales bacterium]